MDIFIGYNPLPVVRCTQLYTQGLVDYATSNNLSISNPFELFISVICINIYVKQIDSGDHDAAQNKVFTRHFVSQTRIKPSSGLNWILYKVFSLNIQFNPGLPKSLCLVAFFPLIFRLRKTETKILWNPLYTVGITKYHNSTNTANNEHIISN